MIAQLINTPCTLTLRLPGEKEDKYGKAIPVEDTVETVCEVQQDTREEPGDQGELSDTRWRAFFPAGTDLSTADSVSVEGLGDFEFVGDPWPARNPRTRQISHVEATLRQVAAGGEEGGS